MPNLEGQESEVRLTIQITRAETGKVEDVELVGTISNDDLNKLKEKDNGSNTLSSGTTSSD